MLVDSGFRIMQVSFWSQTAGLSSFSFTGFTELNFAALICNPILTRHIWFSEISPL